ncbi:hypothetical protein [Granulicella sp. L60]|uniref:hypothetical protein n=1 Tax=Granulicella sp. L60 TaxID=1641866 RepID=UPI00131EAD40|nr:hypothetical protein [Granulicella sp. L60]
MLMLYLFKLELFNLTLNYSYSTECPVIADTREDRGRLIQRQVGQHNRSVVKRSVLVGARSLTCAEINLLELAIGTRDGVWLITRVRTELRMQHMRHLPQLKSEVEMYELMERTPSRYDSYPLMTDQYVHSAHFSGRGSPAAKLPAAA